MGVRDWLASLGREESRKAAAPLSADSIMRTGGGAGSFGVGSRRGTREVLRAYGESPWVHAIVSRLAYSVGQTEWRLYRAARPGLARQMSRSKSASRRRKAQKALIRRRDLEEVESHALLDDLERANPWMSGSQLVGLWQAYLDLAGEGFGVVDMGPSGPVELWPCPPHWMTERPLPGDPTQKFVMQIHGQYAAHVTLPHESVLWFRNIDPLHPFRNGVGHTKSLGDEVDADEYAAKTIKQTFINGARPDILMIPSEPVREEEAKSFLAGWNQRLQGFWNAKKVHFINQKIDVQQIGLDFRELQLVELRTWERDLMIQTFGIPPEVLGVIENSNRATIDSADYLFTSKCVVPRIEVIRGVLQYHLLPLYADSEGLYLDYENPVEEDSDFKRQVYAQAPYAFRVDEHRALAGDAELDGGQGQVFVSPLGMVASDSPGGGFLDEVSDAPTQEEEGDPKSVQVVRTAVRFLAKMSEEEIDAVIRAITDAPMREALDPILRSVVEDFGATTLEGLGLSIEFSMQSPKVDQWLKRHSAENVRRIGRTTRGKIRKVLRDNPDAGVNEIASKIRGVFKSSRGARSLFIAQQETSMASNFAVHESMQQGGIDEQEWLSVRDGSVRESHQQGTGLDGQRVPVDGVFQSPITGATGPYPTAMSIPSENLGCRCLVLAVVDGETGLSSEVEKSAAWRTHEARRVKHQRTALDSVRRAFRVQEEQALSALSQGRRGMG